uniref:Glycerol-3-phosphate dehydrogenase [NAD(+)] n=1 Tax=Hydra vulgaris TaxID=6087 RepID=T2MH43_HYDVU
MASQIMRKVSIVGSGNWGSAIAKIIGNNVLKSTHFEQRVNMYVYEEMVGDRKLSDVINTDHENIKYLPGIKLPPNIVAVPSLVDACFGADVLVFVVPHQFVVPVCNQLKTIIKPGAVGISLIKGLNQSSTKLECASNLIASILGIECGALMGANIAQEVAKEEFCESTVGYSDSEKWWMWKALFHCSYFKVNCVDDVNTVEICGSLKNAVAMAAGFVDALDFGDNTKAAIIRLGLLEMQNFCKIYSEGGHASTLFESCGVADLITTCYGGRNRKVAEAFARTGKSFETLEKEMLNGQKLQGPHTALIAYNFLRERNLHENFPVFSSVYRICYENKPPSFLIDTLKERF